MRKVLILLGILLAFPSGIFGQKRAERIREGGVEVVINSKNVYNLRGEENQLSLLPIFSIDLEDKKIAELGMTHIRDFDVDDEGNVYFLNYRGSDNIFFKFNEKGEFVTSFGRRGQGPGELQAGLYMSINKYGQIITIDPNSRKLLKFGNDGDFLEEKRFASNIQHLVALPNDSYLILKVERDSGTLILANQNIDEIKEIYSYQYPSKDYRTGRIDGREKSFYWTVSRTGIYVGSDKSGYEIQTYDFAGNLIRKLRKGFDPVRFPNELKERTKEDWKAFPTVKIDFPTNLPPFRVFFVDDKDRLIVRTYEIGGNPKEYIHDIFTSKGDLVGRKSLNIFWIGQYRYAKAIGNRLYYFREKDNGFYEFVVSHIRWTFK